MCVFFFFFKTFFLRHLHLEMCVLNVDIYFGFSVLYTSYNQRLRKQKKTKRISTFNRVISLHFILFSSFIHPFFSFILVGFQSSKKSILMYFIPPIPDVIILISFINISRIKTCLDCALCSLRHHYLSTFFSYSLLIYQCLVSLSIPLPPFFLFATNKRIKIYRILLSNKLDYYK